MHAEWNVLDPRYQKAEDPIRIKGVGASEASPTPCYNDYTKITVNCVSICPSMRAVDHQKPSNHGVKSFVSLQSLSITLQLVAH